jgi:hypothetical protein
MDRTVWPDDAKLPVVGPAVGPGDRLFHSLVYILTVLRVNVLNGRCVIDEFPGDESKPVAAAFISIHFSGLQVVLPRA